MSFRLFSRAPRMTSVAAASPAGAPPASAIDRSPRRYAPVSEPLPFGQQLRRRALEDHVPAVLAGARAEVDHVVGGADRLLVVLDDDDGVAEIAQPRQRRRAARGCRAGAGRSTARRARRARRSGSRRSASPAGCAALRRPTASPRCGRASGSRRRRRRGSAAARGSRAGCGSAMSALAIGQLERVEHAAAPRQIGRFDVLGDRPALHADRQALRLQPLALAGRARPQRAVRLEVFLLGPGAFFVAAAQVRDQPFEVRRRTDRPRLALLRLRRRDVSASSRRAACRRAPENSRSRMLLRQPAERQRRDRCRTSGSSAASASRTSLRSPLRPRRDRAVRRATATRPARPRADRSRRPRRAPGTPGRRRAAS